jgi:hypothetical protein
MASSKKDNRGNTLDEPVETPMLTARQLGSSYFSFLMPIVDGARKLGGLFSSKDDGAPKMTALQTLGAYLMPGAKNHTVTEGGVSGLHAPDTPEKIQSDLAARKGVAKNSFAIEAAPPSQKSPETPARTYGADFSLMKPQKSTQKNNNTNPALN